MVNPKKVGDEYQKKFTSTEPNLEFYQYSIPVEKAEQILAEVIDEIYLDMKEDIVHYENRSNKFGSFKEKVKQEFHNKVKDYVKYE